MTSNLEYRPTTLPGDDRTQASPGSARVTGNVKPTLLIDHRQSRHSSLHEGGQSGVHSGRLLHRGDLFKRSDGHFTDGLLEKAGFGNHTSLKSKQKRQCGMKELGLGGLSETSAHKNVEKLEDAFVSQDVEDVS